jgi:surface antigen
VRDFAGFIQKCLPAVAGAGLLALASQAAQAQPTQPNVGGYFDWPGLTDDDLDLMHAAAARLYEGRSVGAVEQWQNPKSGDAGEVKLLQRFESDGMPCRTVDYTVRLASDPDSPEHFMAAWCKTAAEGWKLVVPPRSE